MESSLCEKPERHAPRRLSDHLGLEGLKQKVHSLVDKVYSRTNLMLAWERVRANRGSGGTDGKYRRFRDPSGDQSGQAASRASRRNLSTATRATDRDP